MGGRPTVDHILAGLAAGAGDERVDTLLARPAFRLERIASPPGYAQARGWCDQDHDEWI